MGGQEAADAVRQQCYQRFAAQVDVTNVSRAQWRAVCRSSERAQWQDLLLQLAEGAETASKAERLGLYKAAHAVLPLHGQPLAALAELLLAAWEHLAPDLEWADVLVTTLAERRADARLTPALLEALGRLHSCAANSGPEARKAGWIAYYVQRCGYNPPWLVALSPPPPRRRKRGA